MNLFSLIFSEFVENRLNGVVDVNKEIEKIAIDKKSKLHREFINNSIKDVTNIKSFVNYIVDFFYHTEIYCNIEKKYKYPTKVIMLDNNQEYSKSLQNLLDRYEDLEIIATVYRFDDAIKVFKTQDIDLMLVNGERDVNIIYDFVRLINNGRDRKIPVLWFQGIFLFIIINDQMYRIIYK